MTTSESNDNASADLPINLGWRKPENVSFQLQWDKSIKIYQESRHLEMEIKLSMTILLIFWWIFQWKIDEWTQNNVNEIVTGRTGNSRCFKNTRKWIKNRASAATRIQVSRKSCKSIWMQQLNSAVKSKPEASYKVSKCWSWSDNY